MSDAAHALTQAVGAKLLANDAFSRRLGVAIRVTMNVIVNVIRNPASVCHYV